MTLVAILMLLCGLATHFIKDFARIYRETGEQIHITEYWRGHPYQTLISIIGAIAGFLAMYETGQLTGITAFGVGYMANSMADIIGKRSVEKI